MALMLGLVMTLTIKKCASSIDWWSATILRQHFHLMILAYDNQYEKCVLLLVGDTVGPDQICILSYDHDFYS